MKDKLFSLRNFMRRISNETPSYFRKLRSLLISLGTAGAAGLAMLKNYPELFPAESFYLTICSHMIVAGVIGALISSLPVADNSKAVKP